MYGQAAGGVDLHSFFDLLAIHELAHRFPHQVPFRFPRKWLTEIFPNLCLHAYVTSVEPERIPDLEVFPEAVAAVAASRMPHHSPADFEALYVDVGPQAYGWYQCRLHAAAKRVYDAAGVSVVRRLWDCFCRSSVSGGDLPNQQLARILARDVHPELAAVLTTWPDLNASD